MDEVNSKLKGEKMTRDDVFKQWTALDAGEKKKFKDKGDEDQKRYEQEMEQYKQTQEVVGKLSSGKKGRQS